MSSKNDDNSAAIMGMVFIGVGIYLLAILAFMIAAFVTFVLTILCLLAWNRPIGRGEYILTPEEARGFIGRGIAGSLFLLAFLVFIDLVFNAPINWDYAFYYAAGGYMGGSLGIGMILEEEKRASQTIDVPHQPVSPPPQQRALPAPRQPFEYASWDDEEVRR
jgi:hypothetical protein